MITQSGFSHPVENAQAVFRAVLQAFSRPGLPVALETSPPAVPGLSRGLVALALTLCDMDTPVRLEAEADTPEARRHLRFHCACPLIDDPGRAAFVFIARPESMPRLPVFDPGTDAYPDRSATLIIRAVLTHGSAFEVAGPGVRPAPDGAGLCFCVSDLPEWFWGDWEENHAAYPLGVDIVFVDDHAADRTLLLGLPRTARVRSVK